MSSLKAQAHECTAHKVPLEVGGLMLLGVEAVSEHKQRSRGTDLSFIEMDAGGIW